MKFNQREQKLLIGLLVVFVISWVLAIYSLFTTGKIGSLSNTQTQEEATLETDSSLQTDAEAGKKGGSGGSTGGGTTASLNKEFTVAKGGTVTVADLTFQLTYLFKHTTSQGTIIAIPTVTSGGTNEFIGFAIGGDPQQLQQEAFGYRFTIRSADENQATFIVRK